MEESVLTSTKKILGIGPADNSFDLDVITHINSAFSTLDQVGIPTAVFVEDDSQEWGDCFPQQPYEQLSLIKTCVYLHVRLLFDPPTTSYLINAAQQQLGEHIWRLNVRREETEYVDPDPPGVALDG